MLSENPISQICKVFIFKEDKWGHVKQKKNTKTQKQNVERLKLIKSLQQLYCVIIAILM